MSKRKSFAGYFLVNTAGFSFTHYCVHENRPEKNTATLVKLLNTDDHYYFSGIQTFGSPTKAQAAVWVISNHAEEHNFYTHLWSSCSSSAAVSSTFQFNT